MKKLSNYIFNGKGFGVLALFILALIVGGVFGLALKEIGDAFVPVAQDAADKILPIKIEDGKVVSPENLNKTVSVELAVMNDESGEQETLDITINTTEDELKLDSLKTGLYLSKTKFYTVSDSQVKIIPLEGSFDIEKGDYTEIFKSFVTYGSVIGGLFYWILAFVFLLLFALVLAVVAAGIAKILRRQAAFDVRMRLSVCALIGVYLVDWILGFMNWEMSFAVMCAALVLVQGFVLYRHKQA
ncbi:MAG: DUF1189 family protein [Alphaproteobacteria bacterium]|nr:DUF1189 family protein [Alphaproteobacteria bacterium]